MAKSLISIPVPATVSNGASIDVGSYRGLGFPTLVTLTAGTVQFQESFDGGTTWRNVGTALTAVGVADAKFTNEATHVRAQTTVGTPAATAMTAGLQDRS
jgi:hypothetical protein